MKYPVGVSPEEATDNPKAGAPLQWRQSERVGLFSFKKRRLWGP